MGRPKRSTAKKAATTATKATTTQTTATTQNVAQKEEGVSIIPAIPRQLPLKDLKAAQAAKKAEKKAHGKDEVFIQFGGKELSHKEVLAQIRETYKNSGATDIITSLKAYVKPEESKIYYVINNTITGSIDY